MRNRIDFLSSFSGANLVRNFGGCTERGSRSDPRTSGAARIGELLVHQGERGWGQGWTGEVQEQELCQGGRHWGAYPKVPRQGDHVKASSYPEDKRWRNKEGQDYPGHEKVRRQLQMQSAWTDNFTKSDRCRQEFGVDEAALLRSSGTAESRRLSRYRSRPSRDVFDRPGWRLLSLAGVPRGAGQLRSTTCWARAICRLCGTALRIQGRPTPDGETQCQHRANHSSTGAAVGATVASVHRWHLGSVGRTSWAPAEDTVDGALHVGSLWYQCQPGQRRTWEEAEVDMKDLITYFFIEWHRDVSVQSGCMCFKIASLSFFTSKKPT